MIWVLARRAALNAGASAVDADDVAQVVTERLWRTWERPNIRAARSRGPASWDSYVVVAGRNAWRDVDRSNRRRRGREIGAAGASLPPPARPGVVRRSPGAPSSIDEYLARIEIAEVIRTQLTDRQQRIAWHIFVDGWSLTRVAEELGLSPRTVRAEKTTALARIRAGLLSDQVS